MVAASQWRTIDDSQIAHGAPRGARGFVRAELAGQRGAKEGSARSSETFEPRDFRRHGGQADGEEEGGSEEESHCKSEDD